MGGVMAEEIKVTCRSRNGGGGLAPIWFIGWLFTIGFLKLTFWKGVLALIVWPYYLGVYFQARPHP
jgi:hypothetical protein